MRPLGKVQKEVLKTLLAKKGWKAHPLLCGWTYGTYGDTIRILESLVKRGDVTKIELPGEHDKYVARAAGGRP